MSDVHVIGLPQSNYVWAVRIALAEKGVPHENVPAAPHSPEVSAVHPLGKVPVLRHGAVEFGESRAIIDYVDAVFDGPPLVPDGLDARILSGVWTSIVTTTIEPLLIREYLFAYFFPKGPVRIFRQQRADHNRPGEYRARHRPARLSDRVDQELLGRRHADGSALAAQPPDRSHSAAPSD